MRRFLLTTFLLTIASPAFAEMTTMPGVGDVPMDLTNAPPPSCDITISFGNNRPGAGTDSDTGMSMQAFLDGQPELLSYTETSWGHEGEYNYCVSIKNQDDSRAIYNGLKGLLPISSSQNGPIMIKARHLRAKQIDTLSDPVPPLLDDLQ